MTEEFYQKLVELRRYLHAHPELSGQEFNTTSFLKKKLQEWKIEILEGNLETGLVAQIGSGHPVIALRADIDALPVSETTELGFSSENPGVMHACGHDLHMTSLLGAAKILKERENEIRGTIKLIFQPSEEVGTGANKILESGLVDDVQAFIGYHNLPTIGVGRIGLHEKGVMAAVDRFFVTITGVGSHAAYPQDGIDSVVAVSAVIQNLQQIVSRNVPPLQAAVLSVTHVEAGKTWNVLPENATFEGTIRTFDDDIRAFIKKRFVEVVQATATAYGVTAEIEWVMGANLTYNDPQLTKFLYGVTQKWHKDTSDQVPPSSAGEDFANYRVQAPSVFAFIGSNEQGSSGLHFADMVVLDEALPVAVDYYVKSGFAVLAYL